MKESRLYSFIDNAAGFTLHFLEGTKLVADIKDIHEIGENAKEYYNRTILTTQHMITFLKTGESLGVYIDSEEPYFRFKIETNFTGSMRTLLLPEEFESFPEKLTGVARITKIFPNSKPYTSVVQMNEDAPGEIINKILEESYQTKSKVVTSDSLKQSVMITKLPKVDIKRVIEDSEDISLNEYIIKFNKILTDAFEKGLTEIDQIVEYFEGFGLNYLHSKEVKFNCPCSEERMITNLRNLSHNDLEQLFAEDEKIEARCDYCNTNYEFTKENFQ